MRIDCDQCGGSGNANGHRCPCREEDDKAQALRSRMAIVRKPPTKAAPDAGGHKSPPQTQQRLGNRSQSPQARKPRMYRTQLIPPHLPDEVKD
jgi:hypothetical protein